ncbi:MAG: NADP-dependent 3-hydroxy acid dehydrogenase YdfG [Ignavibacteriaceae bacterium]|nr:NADP-dependent 3-hydroxy acid dehydrogenase YdfG [Ignavibacteriaceae bacterium]
MNRLQNKTVLITGATSGIGRSCARYFASEGASLILFARRENLLEEVKAELKKLTAGNIYTAACDITVYENVKQAVAAISEELKKIDILVNNAGLAKGLEPLAEGLPENWDVTIDTNVKGLLYVTKEVVKGMIERNSGHVINLGSTAGHDVYPNGSVYCASKYAVKAITQTLRIELVATDIRVTTIDPGLVETNFSNVRFNGDTERAKNVYKGITPLTPDDVADAVLYAATRPPHVSINEMILTPTNQANSNFVHKVKAD